MIQLFDYTQRKQAKRLADRPTEPFALFGLVPGTNPAAYGFGGAGSGGEPEVTFCFAFSIFSATFLFSSRARDFCQ